MAECQMDATQFQGRSSQYLLGSCRRPYLQTCFRTRLRTDCGLADFARLGDSVLGTFCVKRYFMAI